MFAPLAGGMGGRMTANQRGALVMTFAMATFALEDMALKAASQDIPIGEALLIFGGGGIAAFGYRSLRSAQPSSFASFFTPLMITRSVSEVAGRLFYALAIALTPLSSASAILQATPLIVALGAVVFFKEKVTLGRWLCILAGLLGVLLILRPGLDGFQPASVFAVLGTIGFAGRDLATRASPVSMSGDQLGVLGFGMVVVAGAVLLFVSGGAVFPQNSTWIFLGLATAIGVVAYAALTKAMRTGEISVVAPFRYSRLLFALILGFTVFGERPDALTLIGSAIVVASGIFLLGHSRRMARADNPGP